MSYNRRTGEFSFEHGRADAGTAAHIALDQFTTKRTSDNKPGGRDLIGHSSVQAWSAGPLFPCVIAVVERYSAFPPFEGWMGGTFYPPSPSMYENEKVVFYAQSLEDRLRSRSFELMLDGRSEEYASREDAERAARMLLTYPSMRARWINGEEA